MRFTTAAALVNELLEARDDKRLLRFQKQLAKQDLLIVDNTATCRVSIDRRRAAVRDRLYLAGSGAGVKVLTCTNFGTVA